MLGGAWRGRRRSSSIAGGSRRRCYGRERVGALAERLERAAGEAPLFTGGAPARPPFVFFDLETTGLSGGAGTLAFLVGCGWFDDDGGFVTRQFLLVRHADERALLEAVADELARAGALVSFNGKSFDAPLLETRYLFHRLAWRGRELPHVDVLHPARRFWKRRATRASSRTALARARRPTRLFAAVRSSASCSARGGTATCPDSRFRRAISSSCAAATRGRSRRCSSTTAWICCRWRR